MNEILFQYEKVDPTTWVYLASLLIIGLFFKFGRFWSVRNLDLLLLLLLSPGLLLVSEGQKVQHEAMTAIAAAHQAEEQSPTTSPPDSPSAPESPGNSSPGNSTSSAVDGQSDPLESTDGSGATSDSASKADGSPGRLERTGEKPRAQPGEDPAPIDELRRGQDITRIGFIWLLTTALLWLIRLLIDPTMVRRPLLEPNMTTGGLTFSCCSLFVFLMANVVASRPTAEDLAGPSSAERLLSRQTGDSLERHGPGYALIFALPGLPTGKMGTRPQVDDPSVRIRGWKYRSDPGDPLSAVDAEFLAVSSEKVVQLQKLDGTKLSIPLSDLSEEDRAFVRKVQAFTSVAKLVAIVSHLAIVLGIVAVGYWHFGNVKMGIGAATLYLMLPYTSQMTGRVDHALPAALLVWAVFCYRHPLFSGMFLGTAIGVIYYPLFLLPLWLSFYWQRGLLRFCVGVVAVLTLMVITLAFLSADLEAFWQCIRTMFGLVPPQMEGLSGIWGLGWAPVYRYPILAAFVGLCGSLAIWPTQKNLGSLLSCSATVLVATQFWHGHGGGLYMAWYLPLLLLTVFRPNLEDRSALAVVDHGWLPRK
ncbi:MAG: SHD1 domain-containing protein [Planctomycetota bacterium]